VVVLLSGCGSELMGTLTSVRTLPRTSQASQAEHVPDQPTPSPVLSPCPFYRPGMDPRDYGPCYNGPGMPLGLGVPDMPHPTPTPRDPLPLNITRDQALLVAGQASSHLDASAQLELVVQTTYGDAPKFANFGGNGGSATGGDRFPSDPAWVVRYKGTFNAGMDRVIYSHLGLTIDGNTGRIDSSTFSGHQ